MSLGHGMNVRLTYQEGTRAYEGMDDEISDKPGRSVRQIQTAEGEGVSAIG